MFKYSDSPYVPKDLMFLYPEYAYIDGIVALGGNVAPEMLIEKYNEGQFPWYNEGEDPILWWSPNPRLVLFPENLIIQRSMRTYFNNSKFSVTYNTCFETVMRYCQLTSRNGYIGSWINEELIESFSELNKRGLAHSIEVWQEKKLVGGLYGLAFGKIFFGESMFAEVPNASKFGFITWVKLLQSHGFVLIDCQAETNHLKSLGATTIPRSEFQEILKENKNNPINYLHTKTS